MVRLDATRADTINPLCICQSCKSIPQECFQLLCGHRQCKTCIEVIQRDIIQCVECSCQTPPNKVLPDPDFATDIKLQATACLSCEWDGLFQDFKDHVVQVHPNAICEFCERKFHSINRLDEHKQNGCNKITIPCPLKEHGCLDSIYRVRLAEHYQSDIHQNTIINVVRRLAFKPTHEQHDRISTMDVDMGQGAAAASSMMTATNENVSSQMQEVYETINILAGEKQTLSDGTQRLSSESVRIQSSIESLTQDFSSLKLSIEEQNSFLVGIKPNQEILQQDVASLKQKVDDMQYVSYDGTLIWKITNFHEKMMDAQSERQTSIYSPPFYSSPTGYKMRARLYLHGDGNARRTHMSLFFVLMRGPNDAILKFPFNYKVTFCLYDQTSDRRHIIDSFRPDIKSNRFQRPRSEMNIARGIPKFFPLAMIQQEGNPYVRDDIMFIKVMVDFGHMSKALTSYALSLNTGLPMNIRQTMINQEAERRAQQQSQQAPTSSSDSILTASPPQNYEMHQPQAFTTIPLANVTNDDCRSHHCANNSSN